MPGSRRTTSSKPALPRIAHVLFFGSLAAAALVIVVVSLTLVQSRQEAWDRAQRVSENLLHSVMGYMEERLKLYTLSLDYATDAVQAGPDELSEDAKYHALRDIARAADNIEIIFQLDAQGNVVRASNPSALHHNFADRDYYTVQRDNPAQGVYISRPYNSRVRNGSPSIALSRRLSNPDGSFAGAVVVSVRLAYIEEFLSRINVGEQGVLLLLSRDGVIIARHPQRRGAGMAGTDISGGQVFKRMQKMDSGAFVGKAVVDSVRRFYTFAHVPNQPLLVNVAFATSDLFGPWWRRTFAIAALTFVTCLLIVVLAVKLRREFEHRMQVEADLARLSLTDALTGLANRRRYDEFLAQTWARAVRERTGLALLMLDVDRFKLLNDVHGHACGDAVLKALGSLVAACTRAGVDVGARYGGEEFAIVLPGATADEAAAVAERLRAACAQLDAGLPAFTISIGVMAQRPAAADSVERFQECADKALYEAKMNGRNCVALAPGIMPAASAPAPRR